MMSNAVKVKYYIETDKVTSRCEGVAVFDRAHWESMTAEEKEAEMREEAFNFMEWGFKELGPDDDDEEIEA